MTGFEEWIRRGLELGAREIFDAVVEAYGDSLESVLSQQPTGEICRSVADCLMKRWPAWRRELLRHSQMMDLAARDTAYEAVTGKPSEIPDSATHGFPGDPPTLPSDYDIRPQAQEDYPQSDDSPNAFDCCVRCRQSLRILRLTPYGLLCPICLAQYIDRLWP